MITARDFTSHLKEWRLELLTTPEQVSGYKEHLKYIIVGNTLDIFSVHSVNYLEKIYDSSQNIIYRKNFKDKHTHTLDEELL